ncbi:hypothetical protein IFR05_015662 [Cadophora sp. M221]|nr:hypothetical protein IFR05_015662 [Cadophora sp. M221]
MVNNDDAFNSSDLEFEAPPEPGAKYGMKSIQSMLKSTFEDRVTSKKEVPGLQSFQSILYGNAAEKVCTPISEVDKQHESIVAVTDHPLSDSVETVPSGDDIVRFFTTITSHMTSMIGHVPRYDTQIRYLNLLIPKLVFEYPEINLSPHECLRISICLKSLLQDGKLTNDPQREAQWVGISLVKRMIVAVAEEAIESRTRSWDVTITKILSIILLGALGARCGDLTLSTGYKNVEYLQWKHIQIKLRPGTEHKLTMRITLRYQKEEKNDPSSNRVVDIDELDLAQDNALCPVKWLLIHALRHGLVQSQSFEDLVYRASRRLDGTVVWTYPEYPVLTSLRKGGVFLQLSKPALSDQLRNTVKYAGLVAGLLALITPHDLRRGCFQDMVRTATGPATSLTDVADIMGHSRSTLQEGTSKKYTNGFQDPRTLEKRIRGATETPGAFDLMTTDIAFKRRRISTEEVITMCESRGLDSRKESERRKVRSQIREQDILKWMEAREDDTIDDAHSQAEQGIVSRPALLSLPANVRNNREDQDENTRNNDGLEDMIDPELTAEDEGDYNHSIVYYFALSNHFYSPGISLNKVSNELVTDLEAALSQNTNLELNENLHAALYPLSESAFEDSSIIPWESDGVQFITFFAEINIVRNARLDRVAAARWADEAKRLANVSTGNSRNLPTPYHYSCTNKKFGCQYHGQSQQDTQKHSKYCKITSEEAANQKYSEKPFKCSSEGCNNILLKVTISTLLMPGTRTYQVGDPGHVLKQAVRKGVKFFVNPGGSLDTY